MSIKSVQTRGDILKTLFQPLIVHAEVSNKHNNTCYIK